MIQSNCHWHRGVPSPDCPLWVDWERTLPSQWLSHRGSHLQKFLFKQTTTDRCILSTTSSMSDSLRGPSRNDRPDSRPSPEYVVHYISNFCYPLHFALLLSHKLRSVSLCTWIVVIQLSTLTSHKPPDNRCECPSQLTLVVVCWCMFRMETMMFLP